MSETKVETETTAPIAGFPPELPLWMFIDKREAQRGPVSLCELKYLIASGQVTTTTYGWREGMSDWAILSHLPELFPVFLEISEMDEGWFYIDAERVKRGPCDNTLLKQLIASQQIHPSTLMWTVGKLVWTPLESLPELQALTKEALSSLASSAYYVNGTRADSDIEVPKGAAKATTTTTTTTPTITPSAAPPSIATANAATNTAANVAPTTTATATATSGSALMDEEDDDDIRDALMSVASLASSAAAAAAAAADGGNASALSASGGSTAVNTALSAPTSSQPLKVPPHVKPDSELTPEELAKRMANRERRKRKKEAEAAHKHDFVEAKEGEHGNVYVTGLPEDVTVEEAHDFFKRAGLIKLDEYNKPRIKLYRHQDGRLKGDGVVFYVRPESVELAELQLSEREIRPGFKVTVSPAQFSRREGGLTQEELELVAAKRRRAAQQKKTVGELAQEQALSWNEGADLTSKGMRIVVIKGMYTPQEARESGNEDGFYQGIREDVAAECEAKCGAIHKLTVFPGNEQGPVVIKFKASYAAQACVELMHKRYFAGRQLTCEYYDGKENFKVRKENESEEDRLAEFAAWLEKQGQD